MHPDQRTSAESHPSGVATHFAPPERSTADELQSELSYLRDDPVVDALLHAVSGLVAVLNEHREVLALNTRMLQLLGLQDAAPAFGLRLGEVVGCTHAHDGPAGCGTTEYCSTCGAAIAQLSSLTTDNPVERVCALQLSRPLGGSDQLFFRIQACPLRRGGRRVLLLFLQDITLEQQRAVLDRTFFHDVNNTLCAILTAGELLGAGAGETDARIAATLVDMTRRLGREIELQRCLANLTMDRFERQEAVVAVETVLRETVSTCLHHPCAENRSVELRPVPDAIDTLRTDVTLLHRVLQNMVINALEDTRRGGAVRVWVESAPGRVEFCVWNDAVISADVAKRVFQRNFSTKGTLGRGLGTYSMKLIGERFLGGRVTFTSQPGQGTCFRLSLPVKSPAG